MSTPKRGKPVPRLHGGRPAAGKHVPSRVPGEGAYDASNAVGSNVTAAHGAMFPDSPDVLPAPPWPATNPNSAQWDPPLN